MGAERHEPAVCHYDCRNGSGTARSAFGDECLDYGAGRDRPFYGAPVVVVVLADRNIPAHVYDGTLVMENLMLAAHAEGLGSCWIHRAKEEFDSPEGKEILHKLGITGDYEGIGHCILGYPAGELPEGKPRKAQFIYRV